MSLNETLTNTGKQVATQAVDTAIDTAVDNSTIGTTVKNATSTLTQANNVSQLQQGLTSTAVSAATSQLPSAAQPIAGMASQQLVSTVGTLTTLKQKPNLEKQLKENPAPAYVTKPIAGTQHSAIEAIVKPARRIGAIIKIGDTIIEEFTSLNITENYGTHHSMTLVVPSPNIKTEKGLTLEQATKLVGEPVEITLTNVLDTNAHRHELKMLVTNIEVEQVKGNNRIIFTCYSPTYMAAVTPNFETLCDKDFDAIIKENCKVLEAVNVKTKIKSSIKGQIPFVCRYNETAFGFIQRMSDTYKQWCYFNGKELIVGEPEAGKPVELIYKDNCDYIKMSMQLTPMHIGYQDYDADTHQPLEHAAPKEAGKLGLWGTQVFNKSKKILRDEGFMYNPAVANREVLEAVANAETGSRATGIFVVTGKTNMYELKMCSLASVQYDTAPEETGKMDLRVIGVRHHLKGDGTYHNNFIAIPAGVAAPPPIGALIPLTHTLEAEVISTDDPRHLGRVKVAFIGPQKTKNNRLSNWMRVATPDAGGGHEKAAKNAGLVSIPEVGSHVKIDFDNGDPHSPYVATAIFHGKTAAGGGKGNNTKSFRTKNGTGFTADDGAKTLNLSTDANNTITIDQGAGGNVTITAAKTITLVCGSSSISMDKDGNIMIVGKNVCAVGESAVTLGSGAPMCTEKGTSVDGSTISLSPTDATLDGKNSASVIGGKGGATVGSEKGSVIVASKDGKVNVSGTMINLNC